jgi:ABC-type multidrug transport system ATPase subunit
MSKITLSNIGKRFRYEWIFQNVNTTFENGQRCAILGPNGVGKSTLMKILSGHLSPSAGTIDFEIDGKNIDIDNVYRHLSYAAPYIEMIEELTLTEAIQFHIRFHPLSKTLTINDLIQILGFEKSRHKEIRYFSSGMRQRLKLALAICSDSPFLLLDEPTTNLDAQGVAWYRDLMTTYTEGGQRLVIIASNIAHDYDFCEKTLNILDYKN